MLRLKYSHDDIAKKISERLVRSPSTATIPPNHSLRLAAGYFIRHPKENTHIFAPCCPPLLTSPTYIKVK